MTKTKSDIIRDNIKILTDKIEQDKRLLQSKKMPGMLLEKIKKKRHALMLEYLYHKEVEKNGKEDRG